jgi:hypothetical protein
VTEEFPLDPPPNDPPSIVAVPGQPAPGEIINIQKRLLPNGWPFTVRIRDENITQELEARLRIVTSPSEEPRFEPFPVLAGDRPERDLTIRIETATLKEGKCVALELAVSGSFVDIENPPFTGVPSGSNDLARAKWWIWEGDLTLEEVRKANADSCPVTFKANMMGATEASPP